MDVDYFKVVNKPLFMKSHEWNEFDGNSVRLY